MVIVTMPLWAWLMVMPALIVWRITLWTIVTLVRIAAWTIRRVRNTPHANRA